MKNHLIASDGDNLIGNLARADIDRRDFLKLLGTSFALASAGCSGPPPEKIIPYARMPENSLPGEPIYYATAFICDGYAHGVLVENNDGRPIKVEGNPHHPASLGGTDAFAQASIYQLWDPDRSQIVRQRRIPSDWNIFHSFLRERTAYFAHNRGEGLRILTGPSTSPTFVAQLQLLLQRYPRARVHVHSAVDDKNTKAGMQLAFGRALDSIYHFENADTVISFDCDFLAHGSGRVRYARDFIARRQPQKNMSRLYAFEAVPNLVGATADYRAAVSPADQERLLWRLAQSLGIALPESFAKEIAETVAPPWWDAMCDELKRKRSASLVLAGPTLPPNAHALAHKINALLGNQNRTISYIDSVIAAPLSDAQGLPELVAAAQRGMVDTLLIFDCNAVYTAPNSAFTQALQNISHSIHLGLYDDETAQHCTWHIPASHTYESWSDARAFDGSASIVQPLITPLYSGKTRHELLALLIDDASNGHDIVRKYWRTQIHADFDNRWSESVRRGFIADTAPAPLLVDASLPPVQLQLQRAPMTLIIAPDPCIHDGSFANNAWLQELPKPLTKLTWDHALALSPATAKMYDISNGDIVEIKTADATLSVPAMVQPLHAENTCSLALGYGRWAAGHVGNHIGVNAYRLQAANAQWQRGDIELRKTGERRELAFSQRHDNMEGRNPSHLIDLAAYLQNMGDSKSERTEYHELPSLYPNFEKTGYQWGMSIDLNACIGCNACVIACQVENNIPVVGREQVQLGRIMHWLRIDRYYDENSNHHALTLWQPVPCMHCENAPCEEVCPVGATVHDSEGLNVQIYNRCIGTRFCSNNCPYKVRRFNFLQYSETESSETEGSDTQTPTVKARQNPEVTVRQRGVMEKCSYCLQRITRARIEAEKQNRELHDGEVVTACQGVCPTRAITFGDTQNAASAVVREKKSPRHYTLLEELNTKPRTTYLARVANSDPTHVVSGEARGESDGTA